MPTVNEAIVTTLRPFILSQIRLVEAAAQSNGLGVRTGQVPVFLEDGGVRPFHRILPDPASMLRSLSSSWRTKPQFQAVHRTWMANAQLSAILSAVQAPPEQVLIMILNNFLADYLEEAIPLHPHYWSEDIFQRLVSVLAEDVHTGRYVVYLWMPAYNVSVTDGCSITLEPGVDLTHPPEDDWVRLTTGVQLFGYPLWQSQRWFVKYEQHSVFNEPVAMTVPPRVQGLLGGMRLVGGGNPKVHEVMMLPRRGGLRTAPGMGAGASLLTTPLGGRKCEI